MATETIPYHSLPLNLQQRFDEVSAAEKVLAAYPNDAAEIAKMAPEAIATRMRLDPAWGKRVGMAAYKVALLGPDLQAALEKFAEARKFARDQIEREGGERFAADAAKAEVDWKGLALRWKLSKPGAYVTPTAAALESQKLLREGRTVEAQRYWSDYKKFMQAAELRGIRLE